MIGVTVSDYVEQIRRLHYFPRKEAMHAEVVSRISKLAEKCIHDNGLFRIVLAGGSTPRAIYNELCTIDSDWRAWHIYFGDERCLVKSDPERNDSMAREVWLSQVNIPIEQVHTIPAELGSEAGARAYETLLENLSGFDLVLLGLGEDGHTASLFPGHTHNDQTHVISVHDAPKLPAERISLSARMLSKAKHVWFLVNGENKREALTRWQHDEAIPARTICPESGVDIFTDIDLGDNQKV